MSNINNGLRIFCGRRSTPLPANSRRGSPLQCFRKGFMIGKAQQEGTFSSRLAERRRATEAATAGVARRRFDMMIQTRGLASLKQTLPLSLLNKDELRSIAVRLSGTPDAIPRYSGMSQEQLREALITRGFRLN